MLNYYLFSSIYTKLFDTFDKSVIMQCQFYTGQLPLKYVLDLKFLNFINGWRYLNDSSAKLFYDWFGVDEYKSITSKYDIVCTDNNSDFRSQIWLTFDRHSGIIRL